MEIKDAREKTIEIGSYIRYTGTGTTGKVVDLKTDEDEDQWVKIDDPNLWYLNEVVELIDEKDAKNKEFDDHKKFNVDDLKDIENELEDATLTSGGAEDGG
ncbi:hypothetical protein ALNOE001_01190 [Candidatus Methanobinarius endosymbioticus]|uniref:DUF2098 domain-containing protein n=1 Tax=Candidatus Methanobinarius endosymbioticus TaxID=2006182 RepID=A0A366MG82_9EURY|nr:hypothetical protein ALNOE001_01190 [Candidatus Methanobinarius endosymbioticus]